MSLSLACDGFVNSCLFNLTSCGEECLSVGSVLIPLTEDPVSSLDSVRNSLDPANTPMSECWLPDGVGVAMISLSSVVHHKQLCHEQDSSSSRREIVCASSEDLFLVNLNVLVDRFGRALIASSRSLSERQSTQS